MMVQTSWEGPWECGEGGLNSLHPHRSEGSICAQDSNPGQCRVSEYGAMTRTQARRNSDRVIDCKFASVTGLEPGHSRPGARLNDEMAPPHRSLANPLPMNGHAWFAPAQDQPISLATALPQHARLPTFSSPAVFLGLPDPFTATSLRSPHISIIPHSPCRPLSALVVTAQPRARQTPCSARL